MAGERKIIVKFDGEDVGLKSASDGAARSLDDVGDAGKRAGEGFDSAGEAAGTLDNRAMGFRDTITGVQDGLGGWNIVSGQAAERAGALSAQVEAAQKAHDKLTESGSASTEEIEKSERALGMLEAELDRAVGQTGSMAEGMLMLGMGIGDLASGFENLIIPVAKAGVTWVSTHVSMSASSIAAAASSVASWIAMAAASVVNAAIVAASWLLAFAPVIIVVAIVVGLVVLIIKNWDTIKSVIQAGWEFVKRITSQVWNAIKAAISTVLSAIASAVRTYFAIYKSVITAVWDAIKAVTTTIWNSIKSKVTTIFRSVVTFIRGQIVVVKSVFNTLKRSITTIMNAVGRAITAPIRTAFQAVKRIWNSTVGGKGFSIPGFLGFGGISFTIPRLAKGGLAYGPTLVQAGDNPNAAVDPEVIAPLSKLQGMMGGASQVTLRIESGGSAVDDFLVELLRKAIANRGGGVVQVLG